MQNQLLIFQLIMYKITKSYVNLKKKETNNTAEVASI